MTFIFSAIPTKKGQLNTYYRRANSLKQPLEGLQLAKPDDRSDNVEKLQEAVQNTIDNLEESESYLNEHAEEIAPQERQALSNKNENRRDAISGFRNEIKDEARANDQNDYVCVNKRKKGLGGSSLNFCTTLFLDYDQLRLLNVEILCFRMGEYHGGHGGFRLHHEALS